jgi:hypothetical protein
LFSQQIEIKGFSYKLVSTELSAKQAIIQATKEALSTCVQEKLGTSIIDLTRLEKRENGAKYEERFNSFSQQISNGYVSSYILTDTNQVFDEKSLTLTTKITLNAVLQIPENDNRTGLWAKANSTFFVDKSTASLNYSVKNAAFIYFFDLNFSNSYCLLYESKTQTDANKIFEFPSKDMTFELEMKKEDPSAVEFGSFVAIASDELLNFGILPATQNRGECQMISFHDFFRVISIKRKTFSILYLPYCIE